MCLKIGEEVDIQISYKILGLGLFETLSFLGFLACFQEKLFWIIFMKNMANL